MKKQQKPKVVIFGFEGTCVCETAKGINAFHLAFIKGLAELLGDMEPQALYEKFELAWLKINRPDSQFGFELDGKVVASASATSTIGTMTCAQVVLRELEQDIRTWQGKLETLRLAHIEKQQLMISPGLLETLRELREQDILSYIVSSDHQDNAKKTLRNIGPDHTWINRGVYGLAKKLTVTRLPEFIPETVELQELNRPIHLRREMYHNILEIIRSRHHLEWEEILVVGDSVELDLILPVILGANGCLVVGINTPAYERNWALAHPTTCMTDTLPDILDIF